MIITEIKQVRSVWAALTSERLEESQSRQILRQCLVCVFPCFLQGFVELHSDGPQTQTGPGAANHKSLNSPCLQMSWEETHTSERWACNGPDHDVYPAVDNDGECRDFYKLINLTRKTKTGTHTDSLLVLQGAINQRFWMTAHTHRQHRFELLWLRCVLWFRSSVRPPASCLHLLWLLMEELSFSSNTLNGSTCSVCRFHGHPSLQSVSKSPSCDFSCDEDCALWAAHVCALFGTLPDVCHVYSALRSFKWAPHAG